MKERPILWSAPMVLALLAGRKTQTRRVAKFEFREGQNPDFSGYTPGTYVTDHPDTGYVLRSRGAGGCWNDRTKALKPYALVGDRLWGRETSAIATGAGHRLVYRADVGTERWPRAVTLDGAKWKPSIFMRRAESRLLHEVTAVRVEKLLDITEEDAIAEGIERTGHEPFSWSWPGSAVMWSSARDCYLGGWDSINGEGSAKTNPWVWCVSFKAVGP